MAQGEAFRVSMHNAADYMAAAIITLDGVNSFAFSKARHTECLQKGEPCYNLWLLAPGE